jgi:hypothetical protein
MFCRSFGDGVIVPDATSDEYTACSAANQSISGEPKGRPLCVHRLYARALTNSSRLSPRKSGMSTNGCCLSGGRDSSGIAVPPIWICGSDPRPAPIVRSIVTIPRMQCLYDGVEANLKVHRQDGASCHRMKGASSGTIASACHGTRRGVKSATGRLAGREAL